MAQFGKKLAEAKIWLRLNMETLQRTANRGSVSTGDDIDNSLKFEADNTEKLSRSQTTGTNRKKFTVSFWVKRTEITSTYMVLAIAESSGNDISFLDFEADDVLRFRDTAGGSNQCILETNRKFRDTSAWYHIVLRVDTTDGTADDRNRIYVNGVQETSFSARTNFTQNDDTFWGYNGGNLTWGNALGEANYYSGYTAEAVYVDGLSLAPTSFGEFDEDTGIWKPIDVSGLTFGNNGYYLDFKDSSNMGNDASGGTDFTETNIAAADQATDTPTNNFCTLMPPQASITGTATVVSEGGTQMKGGSTSSQNAFGSIGVRKGKWYFESNVSNLGGVASYAFMFGVIAADRITALNNGGGYYIGEIANTWGFTSNNRGSTGGTENPNFPSETATSGTTEVMGIALDMDNGKIWVHKAGTYATNNSSVTGNPATGAAPQYDNLLTSTSEHILVGGGVSTSTNAQRNMNFGNPMNANFTGVGTHSDANGYGSFAYAPPSGYYAICTKNLAEYG